MSIRQMSQLESPDQQARRAGKMLYGTAVGSLRRVELYRLGNAWGATFPVGATKDFMIPFFQNLEAAGKDPFKPPHPVPLKASHSAENHGEVSVELGVDIVTPETNILGVDTITPAPKSEFEAKLEALHHCKLKKICKDRGISQTNKDRKQDLIARIVAASEGQSVKNVFDGGQ